MMKRLSRFFGIALILLLISKTAAVEWTRISSYPTVVDLKSVTHGEGVVVAAGEEDLIYSLDSGQTWREVVWPSSVAIQAVTYGNGIFVAVTTDGRSLVSDNGFNWTAHTVLSGWLNTLVFGNGLFVAGASTGTIATSADGVSWNLVTGVSTNSIYLSAYGNGTFLLKDGESWAANVIVSTNGVNWSRMPVSGIEPVICDLFGCSQSSHFAALTFGAGGFVARVDYGGFPPNGGSRSYVSVDGIIWSETWGLPGSPGFQNFNFFRNPLFYENGVYVVVTEGAIYPSTNDLVSWVTHPFSGGTAIEFNGNSFNVVGVGGTVAYGPSLDLLTRVDNPEKLVDLVSVASRGNTIVGVANLPHGIPLESFKPALIVSTNGGRIFQQVATLGLTLSSVRYRNGMFMAVGAAGATLRSADGISWTAAPAVVPETLMDAEYIGGRWIAVGLNGRIITSVDGAAFTQKNSGTDIDLNGVAGGNGRFVAVGDSGVFLTSTDAENWSLSGTAEGTELWGVAYGNSRFVAVGDGGRVYISADGVEWSSRRIIGAAALPRIAFAHGLFLTVGIHTEKTYTSADGTNWTQVNIPGIRLQGADASDGLFFVSGKPRRDFGVEYGTGIYGEKTFSVNAIIGNDGLMQLSWPNPDNGNDSVFATGDLTGNAWELIGTTQTGQWKDTNAISGTRLYRVRND